MGKETGILTPEFVSAREQYRTNLRTTFGQFGFTNAVLKEIMAAGCIPALVYETSGRCDFLPRELNEFLLRALYGSPPRRAEEVGIPMANLTFDSLNFRINALEIWVDEHNRRRIKSIENSAYLDFDLIEGVCSSFTFGPRKISAIPSDILLQLAELPEIIAGQKNTFASSFKFKEG